MNDLHHTFSELEQDVQHTLHETESMKHPLIELIRYSLHEQQQALSRLLPLLKSAALSTVEGDKPPRDDLQSLDAIKPYVTLLYQNQEVSEPTVRAWVRAVQWIPSFETEASGDIQARFNDMHHRLELAGTLLVRLYGQKRLKFVIPAAYTETEVKA